jgi:hypothetical protein
LKLDNPVSLILMAPCPTVLTFESALFLAAKQCINNGESETAAAKKKKL